MKSIFLRGPCHTFIGFLLAQRESQAEEPSYWIPNKGGVRLTFPLHTCCCFLSFPKCIFCLHFFFSTTARKNKWEMGVCVSGLEVWIWQRQSLHLTRRNPPRYYYDCRAVAVEKVEKMLQSFVALRWSARASVSGHCVLLLLGVICFWQPLNEMSSFCYRSIPFRDLFIL